MFGRQMQDLAERLVEKEFLLSDQLYQMSVDQMHAVGIPMGKALELRAILLSEVAQMSTSNIPLEDQQTNTEMRDESLNKVCVNNQQVRADIP